MAEALLPIPATVTLKDGSAVILRPIGPTDAPRLQAFHLRLSPDSIYLRWLSAHPVLSDAEAADLATVDYTTRMAFVAILPDDPEHILGVARYGVISPDRPDEAEAAIVVEDAYQSRGLGTHLLRALITYARAQGIRYWVAEINVDNTRMLKFIQRGGMPSTRRLDSGSWQIRVDLGQPG